MIAIPPTQPYHVQSVSEANNEVARFCPEVEILGQTKKNAPSMKTTAANVGYEAQLWQMADALRGSTDAAEYKHVVLGLIFLKYISDWGGERLQGDKRWQYSSPPKGNANFAWVQPIVHHLAPAGVAGFVLANGSMSSNQPCVKAIRDGVSR